MSSSSPPPSSSPPAARKGRVPHQFDHAKADARRLLEDPRMIVMSQRHNADVPSYAFPPPGTRRGHLFIVVFADDRRRGSRGRAARQRRRVRLDRVGRPVPEPRILVEVLLGRRVPERIARRDEGGRVRLIPRVRERVGEGEEDATASGFVVAGIVAPMLPRRGGERREWGRRRRQRLLLPRAWRD